MAVKSAYSKVFHRPIQMATTGLASKAITTLKWAGQGRPHNSHLREHIAQTADPYKNFLILIDFVGKSVS